MERGTQREPLFSVLVPVLNGGATLDACLASIAAQRDVPIEILVADDGSRDESRAIARAWRERRPDLFRLLEPADSPRGVAGNYAASADHARAPFLAFLEQDDEWPKGYLSPKLPLFEDPQVGVVFSSHRIAGEFLYGLDMRFRQAILEIRRPIGRSYDNFATLCRYNDVATFSAFACRREIWDRVPRPAPRTPYADWWFLAHLAQRSRFRFDEGPRVTWRRSRSSVLGRQPFRDHQIAGAAFIRSLHESLASEAARSEHLPAPPPRISRAAPDLLNLMTAPSLRSFGAACRADLRWAIGMTASLMVNRLKKSGPAAAPVR